MENEKKNNGILVGILIGIIFTLLVVGGLFAAKTIEFKSNTTNNEETTRENKTEKEESSVDFNKFIKEITGPLGWLVVLYNSPEFGERKNVNYLSTIENRQLFTMEYILNNNENYKNFILLDAISGEKTEKESPTDQMTIAYYPYDLFNQEYKKLFDENFDVSKRVKAPGNDNEYDKSEQFIYYANRRPGRNGMYVSEMTVEDTKYNSIDNNYIANINMVYSDKLANEIGTSSEKAEITYVIKDTNIILKSFIVK